MRLSELVKPLAALTLILLVGGMAHPVLLVDATREREAEREAEISEERAREVALQYLTQLLGDAEYVVEEVELEDGRYNVEISRGGQEFELIVDAINGEVLQFERERREGAIQPQISEEQAIGAALQYLTGRLGEAEYVIERVRVKDGNYKVEISIGDQVFELIVDGMDRSIAKVEMEEKEDEEEEDEREELDAEVNLSAQEAIDIAINFLTEHYGSQEYRIEELELDDGVYEIEMINDVGEFEFEIDATDGRILEFEGEIEDLKIEVEEDDKDKLKVKVERRGDGRDGFKLEVEKEKARLKLEFKERDAETRAELDIKVRFDELIEFLDDGSQVGVYDANDTIISIIDLDELAWSVTRVEERDAAGALEMMLITQESSNDRLEKIALLYHLTPTSRSIDFGGEEVATVNIWEVKFDIHIEGYSWENADSMLALSAKFDTEFEFRDLEGEEVRFKTVDTITPFFNWGGLATADSSQIEVMASVEGKEVVLTYPHFTGAMIHDPKIGYLMAPPIGQSAISTLLSPGILAIGLVLVTTMIVVAFLAKRKKTKGALVGSSLTRLYIPNELSAENATP